MKDSRIFFAPCLLSHQAILEKGDFNNSLYYNLLFQPSLAILDTSFYVVPEFKQHFDEAKKKSVKSWIEAALQEKRIVPLVRNNINKWGDVYVQLNAERFAGISATQENKDFTDILSRSIQKWENWPSKEKCHFGRKFLKRITSFFLSSNKELPIKTNKLPQKHTNYLNKFWKTATEWMRSWIPETIEDREKKSKKKSGLRITDLFETAKKKLLKEQSKNVQTLPELFSIFRGEKREHLKNLFILLDQEYLNNLCHNMYKCGIPLDLTRPRERWINTVFGTGFDFLVGNENHQTSEMSDFKTSEIRLPSLKILMQTPGDEIIKIWAEGKEYFTALEEWRLKPDDNNRKWLAGQFCRYCKIILKYTKVNDANTENFIIAEFTVKNLLTFLSCGIGSLAAAFSGNIFFSIVSAFVPFVIYPFGLYSAFKYFQKKNKYTTINAKTGIYNARGRIQITQSGNTFGPKKTLV